MPGERRPNEGDDENDRPFKRARRMEQDAERQLENIDRADGEEVLTLEQLAAQISALGARRLELATARAVASDRRQEAQSILQLGEMRLMGDEDQYSRSLIEADLQQGEMGLMGDEDQYSRSLREAEREMGLMGDEDQYSRSLREAEKKETARLIRKANKALRIVERQRAIAMIERYNEEQAHLPRTPRFIPDDSDIDSMINSSMMEVGQPPLPQQTLYDHVGNPIPPPSPMEVDEEEKYEEIEREDIEARGMKDAEDETREYYKLEKEQTERYEREERERKDMNDAENEMIVFQKNLREVMRIKAIAELTLRNESMSRRIGELRRLRVATRLYILKKRGDKKELERLKLDLRNAISKSRAAYRLRIRATMVKIGSAVRMATQLRRDLFDAEAERLRIIMQRRVANSPPQRFIDTAEASIKKIREQMYTDEDMRDDIEHLREVEEGEIVMGDENITVTVHRKHIEVEKDRYNRNIGKNIGPNQLVTSTAVGNVLESLTDSWNTIYNRIRKNVPYMAVPGENGKGTSLGSNAVFIQPFHDILSYYQLFYAGSSWCRRYPQDPNDSDYDENQNDLIGYSGYNMAKKDDHQLDAIPVEYKSPDPSFAQKIEIPDGDEVIVVGDIHSSLHSFSEIINDLVGRGIIDSELVLKNRYHIIFLGDIVDRGGFGLDILHLIFRLKSKNLSRVFLINGNHEDESTYRASAMNHGHGGFLDEVNSQLSSVHDRNLIHKVMTYIPSVIFAKMDGAWIQFNHGGIDRGYDPFHFLKNDRYTLEYFGIDSPGNMPTWDHVQNVYIPSDRTHIMHHHGLRFGDFIASGATTRGGNIRAHSQNDVAKYLEKNHIKGIVRGHQDFMYFAAYPKRRQTDDAQALSNRTLVGGVVERSDGLNDMLRKTGMVTLPLNHWHGVYHSSPGWQTIPLVNAFEDFTVFTTSSAAKSRNVRNHTYLQLSSDRKTMKTYQSELLLDHGQYISRLPEDRNHNNKYVPELNFLSAMTPESDQYVSRTFELWRNYIRTLKITSCVTSHTGIPNQNIPACIFPLLVLSTYNMIRGDNV